MNHCQNRIRIFKKIAQESEINKEETCATCKKPITDKTSERKDENGNIICQSCYVCPNCGSSLDEEDSLVENHGWRSIPNPIHGCTNCMQTCYACDYIAPKENRTMYQGTDNEYYCEDCFSNYFTNCSECDDVIDNERAHYTDHNTFCESCFYSSFDYCQDCNEATPLQNLNEDERGDKYCESCKPELAGGSSELPRDYSSLEKLDQVSFNKFDRVLNQLKKLLPISVKDLNKKHPRLAAACKDLIAFAKGKDLTSEVIASFETDMPTENFPVGYSVWRSRLQRSVRSSKPQLVINVLASEKMLNNMKEDNTYDLFDKVNDASKQSGHPYVKNQLGWIRVELHPEEKYILVDEIQTDHMNAIDRINTETHQGKSYAEHIMNKYDMTPEEFKQYLNKYKNYIKDFTDIAMETISKFAKSNGFKKIFYHTYESGKKLKDNMPPESLYTALPARHFFEPTEDKPFGLEGNFFARTAERLALYCDSFYKLSIKK